VKLLFVHQNFPGQYRHLAAHYAAQPGNQVVAVGQKSNLLKLARVPGVTTVGYDFDGKDSVARGRTVAAGALDLRKAGFRPDVIFGHIGWGEAIFLKDIFPEARQLLYCEFFYRSRGADLGFDPEFPATAEKVLRLRVMNAPLLMSLDASDWGMAPTRWQAQQFPGPYQPRISVIHDGIDTDALKRTSIEPEDELITYVARNLEPYRGFHVFMRAIPEIQRRRPKARIVIVGGDEVSYSPRLPAGETYRARLLKELDGKIDLARVQFLGRIPYGEYVSLLHRSSVHVYLTYPFVLSWSLLEAMAAGCAVIGSRTPPVQEVIEDGKNGHLFDFFSTEALAGKIDQVLKDSGGVREAARQTILERFDLKRVCLPGQQRLVERLAGVSAARQAA
jgi:glycosyltransferase involved in cell wall biosynthesis